MTDADLLIVGAGPAGMAAAATAAYLGLTVALLDEQPAPGGQIYRAITSGGAERGAVLGPDYLSGKDLADALGSDKITLIPGATVWQIDEAGWLAYSQGGVGKRIAGRRILLANGALERPMPIPGWTLPGVMTAGAGQILLKQSGMVAEQAVLAGSGPLLYLLAQQMIRAGCPPLALVETQTLADLVHARRYLLGALRDWRTLAKGSKLLSEIRRAGVKRYRGASELRVEGQDKADSLVFQCGGKQERLACQTVLLHHGVVPNTQATRALRLEHDWDERQRCFRPRCDRFGATAIANLYLAGDGKGIGGAQVAETEGRLAAVAIAHDLERIDTREFKRRASPLKSARKQALAARALLDTAYPPYAESLRPSDETLVCRCEEVTAGQIRGYAKRGCQGPNQTKAFGRPGMGPCQGRYCGLTVTEILAEANGTTPEEVGYYRLRQPLKPVSLGEFVGLTEEKDPA
ncbi:MAG: NAD(P)/FAD-dependent oxidoreductase [Kiloniellales bacterium]